MKILYSSPENNIARVHMAELHDGARIEFVESTQPPFSIFDKWVLIVSTLRGCPIDCPICDAGGNYKGKLSEQELLDQITYMVQSRFPDGKPLTKRLKIQFARMGEPAFNSNVLKVLKKLPSLYDSNILMPSISTVAPNGTDAFFDELIDIKNTYYSGGRFQLQFSLHTTDQNSRKELIPSKIWDFKKIAEYGERFYKEGDRKITLNFATPFGYELAPEQIKNIFDTEKYLIKYTPVNPTKRVLDKSIRPLVDVNKMEHIHSVDERFRAEGYDTIISIGELEENQIGSNCGMYLSC